MPCFINNDTCEGGSRFLHLSADQSKLIGLRVGRLSDSSTMLVKNILMSTYPHTLLDKNSVPILSVCIKTQAYRFTTNYKEFQRKLFISKK